MAEQPHVVVVASYMHAFVVRAERFPADGETVFGHDSEIGPGGKGSNQAVGAARLGASVTVLASVGTDAFGEAARQLWRDEGLHTDLVVQDPARVTGMAFIMVDGRGQNRIVVAPGANDALTVSGGAAERAIASAQVVVAQFESPVGAVTEALTLARRHGALTILNPAPARDVPDSLLALADVITPNESEAAFLCGLPEVAGAWSRAARALRERGPRTVVLTLGERGAFVLDERGERHIPAIPVTPLDTTGAGDAFTGALAVALGRGAPIDEAVAYANLAGAFCVTRPGVVPGLGAPADLEQLRAAHGG